MGIPAYFSYIVKQHGNIIQKFNSSTLIINNLLLDCNSIIYDCVRNIEFNQNFETNLIKAICEKIKYYIQLIKPNNIVYIAFDGVAPVSKLEQQRTRRYKSQFTNELSNILSEKQDHQWNTSNITPGTDFMNSLSKFIYKYFNDPTKFNVKVLTISTSKDAGEGEHKLFEDIRLNSKYRIENTVVYGLDADLIMLSLNHLSYCKNIYLFRETPEFIKHLDSSLSPNELYVLDINNLSKNLLLDLNQGKIIEKEFQKNKINDYIFICFMLGNDFIPHIPSINIRTNGMTHLLDAYKISVSNDNKTIINDNTISWSVFRKFIKHLSDNELDYYYLEYKTREKQSKRYFPSNTVEEKLQKFLNLPLQNREEEIYINPGEEFWESRYYQTLFNLERNDINLKKICINYLEALEWTFKYYTTGCENWRWKYNYNYPPLMKDLIQYIPFFETNLIEKNLNNPVKDYVQLSYVLPYSSLDLLPEQKYKLLVNKIQEFYPVNCKFHWSFCKYFWESHIDLPQINLTELEKLLG